MAKFDPILGKLREQDTSTTSGSGDVTGPAGAVADDIAIFNGGTGKIIKDGGKKITDLLYLDQTTPQSVINGAPIMEGIDYDTTPSLSTTLTAGKTRWNATDETLDIGLNSQVILQVGQEEYIRVVNKTGVQINDGEVVRVSGAQGNRPTAVLAQADAFTKSVVIGIATQNIPDNQEGFVTTHGIVRGFNTSGFSSGDYLYLDSVTPGTLTNNITTPLPAFIVPVAVALNSTNNGSIFVSPFYPRSTDVTLAGNSNSYTPSEKAIKTYVDTLALGLVPYTGATANVNLGIHTLDVGPYIGTSISGVGKSDVGVTGIGIFGQGTVNNTTNTTNSIGLYGKSIDTHSGGNNLGVFGIAYGGVENYSFFGAAGDIYNNGNVNITTGNKYKINNVDLEASDVSALPTGTKNIGLITTGIADRTKSTISFDNTSHVFTITPTSGTFDIYLSGVKYAKGTCTVDLDTVGLVTNTNYFLYFDSTGTLQGSTTAWNIESNACPVATVYWNGSTGRIGDERHGAVRNLAWHQRAHDTIGTRYESGLDATFTSSTTSINGGYIDDEDIEITITGQTQSVIWYRNAGATAMTFDDTPVNYCAKIVTGALQYDNGGTLTAVSSGYYIRNRVYATNDPSNPIYTVIGQNQYSNINDARDVVNLTFPNYPSQEMKLLYRTIWQNVGGTPTYVESADYRTAPTTPKGGVATRPIFLNDLEDVVTPSPAVDDVLAYNGVNWISKTGASVSGGNGVEFFNATPLLNTRTSPTGLSQDGTAGNGIQTATLSATPVTTTEQTAVGINNGDTRPFSAWLGPVLNRTILDAGTWNFTTYASVSSTANTPQLIRAVYQVVPGTGTLAFSGAGANSRTATITAGTPFQGTYYTANATNTVASWIQATSGTDQGMYQITGTTSTSVATCTVRTGYANESGVTYNIWNLLFTASIPLTSTTAIKYDTTSTQSAFTVATTDKIGSMMFVTSTANARTVTVYYNGTSRNTHVLSPLKTLHNQLSGLQGGTSNEYYHMTLAQQTVLSNTSGTNTGDQDLSGYLLKSTYDANTVLYATTDNTPVALTVGEQTIVGRATGGSISALAIDSDLTSVSANDDTVPSAKATKTYADLKLPLAGGTLTGTLTPDTIQLQEKSIKLDSALSADGTWCGVTESGTGGETLAFGELCYFKASDSKRYKAKADSTTTSGPVKLGFCVLAGASTTTEILLFGKIRADSLFPTLTIGGPAWVSGATAGVIATSAPTTTDYVGRIVGYGNTADELFVQIDNSYYTYQ